MQRERERDRDREQQLRERDRDPREFAPHSSHPSPRGRADRRFPLRMARPLSHNPNRNPRRSKHNSSSNTNADPEWVGWAWVQGGVQTGPRGQFQTSFVPVREASPPLPPPGSGVRVRWRGGGNAKTAGMLMRDAYGTRSPAMDKWEMGANNANNANANSSYNSGVVGGSNTGLGVGQPGRRYATSQRQQGGFFCSGHSLIPVLRQLRTMQKSDLVVCKSHSFCQGRNCHAPESPILS
ncbi:hypothetical protein B0H16DRAFT_629851 [Mycena metata]|uniref:Uncharacterized protein n=1 Tax=Mycena metata TaxID=1033252 RepID=A0AAD7J7Z0_9AGAR|nr:hypothetical protein B0H16DRAFT_629851 [Mycena metata]